LQIKLKKPPNKPSKVKYVIIEHFRNISQSRLIGKTATIYEEYFWGSGCNIDNIRGQVLLKQAKQHKFLT